VNGIVNRLKELSNLVDAEQRICVEYEGNDNLSRRECSSFKRCVTSVCESIAAELEHHIRGLLSPALMAVSPQSGQGPVPKRAYSATRFHHRAALAATLLM